MACDIQGNRYVWSCTIPAAVASLKQHGENWNVLEKPLGMGVMGDTAPQPQCPQWALPASESPPLAAQGSSELHWLFSF